MPLWQRYGSDMVHFELLWFNFELNHEVPKDEELDYDRGETRALFKWIQFGIRKHVLHVYRRRKQTLLALIHIDLVESARTVIFTKKLRRYGMSIIIIPIACGNHDHKSYRQVRWHLWKALSLHSFSPVLWHGRVGGLAMQRTLRSSKCSQVNFLSENLTELGGVRILFFAYISVWRTMSVLYILP